MLLRTDWVVELIDMALNEITKSLYQNNYPRYTFDFYLFYFMVSDSWKTYDTNQIQNPGDLRNRMNDDSITLFL